MWALNTENRLPREWMRQLAALRQDAVRLRTRAGSDRSQSDALIQRALELTDVLRETAAELHAQCVGLERALADRDRRLREFFESIPIAVVATDRGAVVVDANVRAASLLGRSVGRLRHELLLHYAEDRATFSAIIQSLPALSDPFETRMRIRPRERATLDVGVTVAPDVRDDSGHFLWFFSTC